MHYPVDDLVAGARVAAAFPQDANGPDIRVRPTDARFGSTSFKKAEAIFARKSPPLTRLLTYGRRMALAAGVLGSAWIAGSYFSGGQSQSYAMKPQPSPSVVAQESIERAELLRMREEMAEEIRALQARVEAVPAARSLSVKDAAPLEDLKRRLDAVKRETGAAIAELAGKVERMQRDATAKFSQVSEQRNQKGRQIPASLAASSQAVDSDLAVGTIQKQARKRRDDAFDPSQNPGAPGVPRALGSPTHDREHQRGGRSTSAAR
ncbi:MAG: hypothetical protein U1E25_15445 [Methylocystis sp.]